MLPLYSGAMKMIFFAGRSFSFSITANSGVWPERSIPSSDTISDEIFLSFSVFWYWWATLLVLLSLLFVPDMIMYRSSINYSARYYTEILILPTCQQFRTYQPILQSIYIYGKSNRSGESKGWCGKNHVSH